MHTTFSLITASQNEQSPSIAVVVQDHIKATVIGRGQYPTFSMYSLISMAITCPHILGTLSSPI